MSAFNLADEAPCVKEKNDKFNPKLEKFLSFNERKNKVFYITLST
jgi:hypothetical protein